MKRSKKTRQQARTIRHKRITKKLRFIHNVLPRLVVTKTSNHIYAQIFDDAKGVTIVSASSLQMKLANGNAKMAEKVGQEIAKKALKKDVKKIVFDRGGCKYHGRVKALADAARAAGLEF